MTLAEKWKAEGEAKGKAEGEAKALREVAGKLPANGTEPQFVVSITGLELQVVLSLKPGSKP